MTAGNRLKIYHEEVKTRQTTHWDLDYLPAAEVERMMNRDPELVLAVPPARADRLWRRLVASLAVVALLATVYLVAA